VVVNATGIFADALRRMDDAAADRVVALSRGSHIVLDAGFLPGEAAILVPRTEDGRVVFLVPWQGRTLVGTTDISVASPELEPVPTPEEIDYLLRYASLYLSRAPGREDVLAAFAGLRPLVRGDASTTARLGRDHAVLVSGSGLVTITGGKWTTYRRMAQDAVDRAAEVAGLPVRRCVTERCALNGSETSDARWREIGASATEIRAYESRYPGTLHSNLPYSAAMAAYVVDREMPVNLDDVLSRRLRALLLHAAASVEAAPAVASLMAERRGHDEAWIASQIERYRDLARTYGLEQSAPGRSAS
jgi:glycerol-3-phosphate dehydrogenase